jgi:kynurenine 3-monooxygenase
VGAGLAGSVIAVALARLGHEVSLFESRPDPRDEKATGGRGRSINLAISTRGLSALELAGVRDEVLSKAVSMRGRMIHSPTGSLAFQPYGIRAEEVIHSVSRAELNRLLQEAARGWPGVSVRFGMRLSDLDLAAGTLTFEAAGEGGRTSVEAGAEVIVGADGAFSAVRRRLQREGRFDYSQAYLGHGYKELTIPPTRDGEFAMEPHALHIWPRGGLMMIALPNADRSFTATLFWPFDGETSFAAVHDPATLEATFRRLFPDATALMPDLETDFFGNPTGSLVTIRCRPWRAGGRAVLIGDACHAVVPFYGQGANAAFEDCLVLSDCLERHENRFAEAFTEYEDRRRRHVNALADLALANFIEMRDHTGSRLFLARKTLERTLHRLFPRLFVPLYTMVTFTHTPYADAVRRSRRQWAWAGAAAAALAVAAAVGVLALIRSLS